ncbi:MAG TPA: hypothetical protein VEC12_13750 [Bacteroidia bacterium]|nr:hypothetical protein [Bacteroidia bacterium]
MKTPVRIFLILFAIIAAYISFKASEMQVATGKHYPNATTFAWICCTALLSTAITFIKDKEDKSK